MLAKLGKLKWLILRDRVERDSGARVRLQGVELGRGLRPHRQALLVPRQQRRQDGRHRGHCRPLLDHR
jgi:hypothetical protein